MANSSCSHWWHAPIYTIISVTLAIVAITTSSHHHHSHSKPQTPSPPPLSRNASTALTNSGFGLTATLLHASPNLFILSPSDHSTVFAVHDSAMASAASLPRSLLINLLRYHTSPSKLSIPDLLQRPKSSCIPTLLHGKNLEITKIGKETVEINGVLVSHPALFTDDGHYTIHGVLRPFHLINPLCTDNSTDSRNEVPWARIVRLLSSSGFVSFAIGLYSVLDGILGEDLSSVTIFAPPDFEYVASPVPVLERIVRFHVLPERFSYKELASLPKKALLRTLVGDSDVDVTMGDDAGDGIIAVNGVEITAPDVLGSKEFVIHGISRPLDLATMKLSTTSS